MSAGGHWVRIVIALATGAAWAASSIVLVIMQPAYWNPAAAIDFVAVYLYTAAWLLSAASLLVLRGLVQPGAAGSRIIVIVAVACFVAGIANALEDGVQLETFGLVYVVAALLGGLGMFAVALVVGTGVMRSLCYVPALGGVAIIGISVGLGVIGLMAWGGLALAILRARPANEALVHVPSDS